MNVRKAYVFLGKRLAGTISQTSGGFVFQYDPTFLIGGRPISLTMPLRVAPYVSDHLPSFFEGLLPEGWYLEIASKVLKIAPDDKFGLLLATCRDCIGAASIVPV
jgi:serine/threonine-protein kinase HipA